MIDKPKIAIGFDTIVDEDFGLISLIFNEYLDPSVFDVEKFRKSVSDILKVLYTREEINPLLSFINDDYSKESAEELYKEFIDNKYNDILKNSIGTSVQQYIQMLKNSGEYSIIIFCYNEYQLNYLNEIEEFNFAKKVIFDEKDIRVTNQFYFKYIQQSFPLKDLVGANLYFSTIGPNLNENKDDLKSLDEILLMKKTNYVKLYSLYDFNKMDAFNSSEGEIL